MTGIDVAEAIHAFRHGPGGEDDLSLYFPAAPGAPLDGKVVQWDNTAHTFADATPWLLDRFAVTFPVNESGDVTGPTDRINWLAAIDAAVAAGGGTVVLTGQHYWIDQDINHPALVNVIGQGNGKQGSATTEVICVASDARVSFGDLSAATRGGLSGSFLVNGNGVATDPLVIDRVVQRTFLNLDSRGGTNSTRRVNAAQNCSFVRCEASDVDGGWSTILDMGASNNHFHDEELAPSMTGLGSVLIQQTSTPAGSPTSCADNAWWGGIFEHTNGTSGVGQAVVKQTTGRRNAFHGVNVVSTTPDIAFPHYWNNSTGSLIVNGGHIQANTGGGNSGIAFLNDGGGQINVTAIPAVTNVDTVFKNAAGTISVVGGIPTSSSYTTVRAGTASTSVLFRNETGLLLTLDASTTLVAQAQVAGDTKPRWQTDASGKHQWGTGAATVDTNLYRSGVGILKTDGQIVGAAGVTTVFLSGAGKVTAADSDFTTTPADGTVAVVENTTDSSFRKAVRAAGAWLVTRMFPGDQASYVRCASDSSPINNSSVLVADATLLLPVAASAVYKWEMHFISDASTTADLSMQLSGPAGATCDWVSNGLTASATSGTGSVNVSAQTITSTTTIGGSGGNSVVHGQGLLVISTTAGNIGVKWAQNTPTVEDTHRKAGSWMTLIRLA